MPSIHASPTMPFQKTVWRNGQQVKDTVEQSMLAVEGKIFTWGFEIRDEIQHPFVVPIALCHRWLAHSRSISVARSVSWLPWTFGFRARLWLFFMLRISRILFCFLVFVCLILRISRIWRQNCGAKAQPLRIWLFPYIWRFSSLGREINQYKGNH